MLSQKWVILPYSKVNSRCMQEKHDLFFVNLLEQGQVSYATRVSFLSITGFCVAIPEGPAGSVIVSSSGVELGCLNISMVSLFGTFQWP